MRFIVRLTGYLLSAVGFVALVIDGARSIANSAVQFTALGTTLEFLLRERYQQIQPVIERNIHPLLWDPVVLGLMRSPACLVALAFGLVLVWLGTPPQPVIGVVTRR